MPRVGPLAVALVLLSSPVAAAEKQVRGFVGLTFAGETTFFDAEQAAGGPNRLIGASAVLIGEVVGIEADVGWSPGFFQSGDATTPLVSHSGVSTVMGNIIVAMPKRLTEYTLRPYAVAGMGLMHLRIDHPFGVLSVSENLPSIALGGGAIGFVGRNVGVAWDVRRISSVKSAAEVTGITIGGPGRLSFWRASMALVVRY
jgi:hypothetical protein